MKNFKKHILENETLKKKAAFNLSSFTVRMVTEAAKTLADKHPDINKIIVFGSAANNSMNKFSDIDVYVDTIKPEKYWLLKSELSKLLNREVDLVTPDDDPYFTNLILKNGKTVYERKD